MESMFLRAKIRQYRSSLRCSRPSNLQSDNFSKPSTANNFCFQRFLIEDGRLPVFSGRIWLTHLIRIAAVDEAFIFDLSNINLENNFFSSPVLREFLDGRLRFQAEIVRTRVCFYCIDSNSQLLNAHLFLFFFCFPFNFLLNFKSTFKTTPSFFQFFFQ